MKRTILLLPVIIFIATCTLAKAQNIDTTRHDNYFLGALHFINGKAKVTFKAFYYDIHMAGPLVINKKTPKDPYRYKSLLNERIYSGTEIAFKIKGDSTVKSAPLVCRCTVVNHLKYGAVINLTCIVFKDYKDYKGGNFYVIKDVTISDSTK